MFQDVDTWIILFKSIGLVVGFFVNAVNEKRERERRELNWSMPQQQQQDYKTYFFCGKHIYIYYILQEASLLTKESLKKEKIVVWIYE